MKPQSPGRRRLLVALACAAPAMALRAQAAPPEVGAEWPQAALSGQARLRFLGLHIYDARLWSPAALRRDGWPEQDFALELQYARSLDGGRISERSIDEMKRQGALDAAVAERWLTAMRATFPDVADGDRLTGLHRAGRPTRFFLNGRPIGEWRDDALARRFFGIWLAPQTSEPALREALFGGRP